jgi:hypothetical protein
MNDILLRRAFSHESDMDVYDVNRRILNHILDKLVIKEKDTF